MLQTVLTMLVSSSGVPVHTGICFPPQGGRHQLDWAGWVVTNRFEGRFRVTEADLDVSEWNGL